MTLLEAMVALVILALSGVAYLEVFQGDARAVRRAAEWTAAAAAAESAMELTLTGADSPTGMPLPAGAAGIQVQRRPWRGRVQDVVVQVRMADGASLEVHRLTRDTLP